MIFARIFEYSPKYQIISAQHIAALSSTMIWQSMNLCSFTFTSGCGSNKFGSGGVFGGVFDGAINGTAVGRFGDECKFKPSAKGSLT